MPNTNEDYNFISAKMNSLKDIYPFLRDKPDSFVFSALCIKSSFYKNPSLILHESDFKDYIVDGAYDGGVDFLLSDPNSDSNDLVIGQAKYYHEISSEIALNALVKMAYFYQDMISYRYDKVSESVQRKFLTLYSEIGDESKIHFVLYTSAQKNRIRTDRLEDKMRRIFSDSSKIVIDIFFATDIVDEIKESESRRPTVESGKICIDEPQNILKYQDDAIIVNISALSLKRLYATHNTNLLSKNLRYYIKSADIDRAINETINGAPDCFWFRNNGITIICDSFCVDGREVKLKNFSIINGGQTTYMIHKSRIVSPENDFYLPCKIIKAIGNNENDKSIFGLEIAKATNSQKAIKKIDLKANAPEQLRFVNAMREEGVFFQTKRGEEVPSQYSIPYKNSDLVEIGKLCLAGVFQIPCSSRNKPSSLYLDKYYNPIFNGSAATQRQIAGLCREFLYIDYYFKKFIRAFDEKAELMLGDLANDAISFAHNARTICIAFVSFASRYYQNNINDQLIVQLKRVVDGREEMDSLYDSFRNIDGFRFVLPTDLFQNKDEYDKVLENLFNIIIEAGVETFSIAKSYQLDLNQTNFLKKDQNYYKIVSIKWPYIQRRIKEIFDALVC